MNLCMACYPAPKEDLDPSEESGVCVISPLKEALYPSEVSGVGLKKELVYKSS